MSPLGKALFGWILICLIIVFSGNILEGIGTFTAGIGIGFLISAMADWIEKTDGL